MPGAQATRLLEDPRFETSHARSDYSAEAIHAWTRDGFAVYAAGINQALLPDHQFLVGDKLALADQVRALPLPIETGKLTGWILAWETSLRSDE